MPERMSDAAAARVEALCDKAAGPGGDDAIRRELRGHMEDELLAYLSGQRPLSEEDALILVEKHFGDPAVVRSLLEEVHQVPHHVPREVPLLPRLVGIVVVALAGGLANSLILGATGWLLGGRAMYWAIMFAPTTLSAVYLWTAALWWTRLADRGRAPWFERWPVGLLVGLIPVLFVLGQGVKSAAFRICLPQFPPYALDWNRLIIAVNIAWVVLTQVASLLAWVWWCDWPARGTRRAWLGAAAWAGWYVIPSLAVVAYASLWIEKANMGMLWTATLGHGAEVSIVGTVGLGLYWLVTHHARQARLAT